MNLHEQLIDAVTYHRTDEVKHLLERGADPNYETFIGMEPAERMHQPYTPLRLVMFRISDSLLEEEGLRAYAEIAKLLLQHGAKAQPAMELAEIRYGKYQPGKKSDLFMQVWDIIAMADRHDGA